MWQSYVMQMLDTYVATGDYTVTQWQRMCNISVKQSIDNEYGFTNGYSIISTGNIEEWAVSPDPSDDADFITFIAYKTWCNIYNGTLADKAANASRVSDGSSAIDTRNSLPRGGALYKTPCELFSDMLEEKYGSHLYIQYNFALE